MNVLISGGCKSGKSGFAQEIAVKLSAGGKKYYVATMMPYDSEDRARITKHIADRDGMGFETLEIGSDIAYCIDKTGGDGTYLIDSITALLLNEMFLNGYDDIDPNAVDRCVKGLKKVLRRAKNAVFVTDYIYSDAVKHNDFTDNYRSSLAKLDRFLAKECDTAIELCSGNIIIHKGDIFL